MMQNGLEAADLTANRLSEASAGRSRTAALQRFAMRYVAAQQQCRDRDRCQPRQAARCSLYWGTM